MTPAHRWRTIQDTIHGTIATRMRVATVGVDRSDGKVVA